MTKEEQMEKVAVTKRVAGIPTSLEIVKPGDEPNVPAVPARETSTTRHVLKVIAIRVARIYGVSFLGMFTTVMSGIGKESLIAPADFFGKLELAAGLALAPAITLLITNAVEVLVRLDSTQQ